MADRPSTDTAKHTMVEHTLGMSSTIEQTERVNCSTFYVADNSSGFVCSK